MFELPCPLCLLSNQPNYLPTYQPTHPHNLPLSRGIRITHLRSVIKLPDPLPLRLLPSSPRHKVRRVGLQPPAAAADDDWFHYMFNALYRQIKSLMSSHISALFCTKNPVQLWRYIEGCLSQGVVFLPHLSSQLARSGTHRVFCITTFV